MTVLLEDMVFVHDDSARSPFRKIEAESDNMNRFQWRTRWPRLRTDEVRNHLCTASKRGVERGTGSKYLSEQAEDVTYIGYVRECTYAVTALGKSFVQA